MPRAKSWQKLMWNAVSQNEIDIIHELFEKDIVKEEIKTLKVSNICFVVYRKFLTQFRDLFFLRYGKMKRLPCIWQPIVVTMTS